MGTRASWRISKNGRRGAADWGLYHELLEFQIQPIIVPKPPCFPAFWGAEIFLRIFSDETVGKADKREFSKTKTFFPRRKPCQEDCRYESARMAGWPVRFGLFGP
jgi:hypothetical protein